MISTNFQIANQLETARDDINKLRQQVREYEVMVSEKDALIQR